MKEKILVSPAAFICGFHKVVILEDISMELYKSLQRVWEDALVVREGNEEDTCRFFVSFISLELYLPIQVLPLPHKSLKK